MSWNAAASGVVATTEIGSHVIHSLARASLGALDQRTRAAGRAP